MKSIEIQNLDQHLKPLQVDGVSTGLELSTEGFRISSGELEIKNLTSETAKVNGDITVDGNIEMTGSSGTRINMYNDVYLEATSTNDYLTISAKNIFLNGSSNYVNSDVGIFVTADSGYDAKIAFMEGTTTNWSIGNDGGESTNTLSFSSGITLGTNEQMSLTSDGLLTIEGSFSLKEKATADADVAAYGQLWVKDETPNELYFTTDAGNDIQITDGTSLAGGGGGTQRWTVSTGGYKVNNNSSSLYYFQYRPNNDGWNNTDSTPTSINIYDSPAAQWIAPAAGTLTNITVQGYVNDTGATDPFKFYVFKGQSAHDSTSTSLTQIGVTNAITAAAAARNFRDSTDISSSNTFSEGDAFWIMLKKDSTSGNQDLYFTVTISGEYS